MKESTTEPLAGCDNPKKAQRIFETEDPQLATKKLIMVLTKDMASLKKHSKRTRLLVGLSTALCLASVVCVVLFFKLTL